MLEGVGKERNRDVGEVGREGNREAERSGREGGGVSRGEQGGGEGGEMWAHCRLCQSLPHFTEPYATLGTGKGALYISTDCQGSASPRFTLSRDTGGPAILGKAPSAVLSGSQGIFADRERGLAVARHSLAI